MLRRSASNACRFVRITRSAEIPDRIDHLGWAVPIRTALPMNTSIIESIDVSDMTALLPIVVGAHLEAEIRDRSLAEALRWTIDAWCERQEEDDLLDPVVCTDLWYLNTSELMLQPTIVIGDPAWNAASAYFATRVPSAMIIDEAFRIHVDPEFVDLKACLWGTERATTQNALETFTERYLRQFLASSNGLADPES